MAVKQTYNEPTNREALSDMISMLDPLMTPINSMIGKAKATATKDEWPEEALASPGDNKHVEGASNTSVTNSATNRTRLFNYTQIFKKKVDVSKTQEAVATAGVTSEMDHQMVNRMLEIGADVEWKYINSTAAVAGSTSVERELGGIQAYVTTNNLANGGTARFITEDLLNDGLMAAWNAGGKVKDIIMSGANKRRVSKFTGSAQKNVDATSKKLIASVDTYDSDFGLVTFHPSTAMPATMIFGLDKGRLKRAELRPFKRTALPETDDAYSEIIVGELTLRVLAEKAHFIISDLKTS